MSTEITNESRLMRIQETIFNNDSLRDTIPDGEYRQILDDLMKVYNNIKNAPREIAPSRNVYPIIRPSQIVPVEVPEWLRNIRVGDNIAIYTPRYGYVIGIATIVNPWRLNISWGLGTDCWVMLSCPIQLNWLKRIVNFGQGIGSDRAYVEGLEQTITYANNTEFTLREWRISKINQRLSYLNCKELKSIIRTLKSKYGWSVYIKKPNTEYNETLNLRLTVNKDELIKQIKYWIKYGVSIVLGYIGHHDLRLIWDIAPGR